MSDTIEKDDGTIEPIPVIVYPKAHAQELDDWAKQARDDLRAGKLSVYATADDAIAALHASID